MKLKLKPKSKYIVETYFQRGAESDRYVRSGTSFIFNTLWEAIAKVETLKKEATIYDVCRYFIDERIEYVDDD